MSEPLTADERAALRAICETWERPSLASAVVLRLLDEREALAMALDDLTATVEDASAELGDDFQRPHDLACELAAAVRRARAKSEG